MHAVKCLLKGLPIIVNFWNNLNKIRIGPYLPTQFKRLSIHIECCQACTTWWVQLVPGCPWHTTCTCCAIGNVSDIKLYHNERYGCSKFIYPFTFAKSLFIYTCIYILYKHTKGFIWGAGHLHLTSVICYYWCPHNNQFAPLTIVVMKAAHIHTNTRLE